MILSYDMILENLPRTDKQTDKQTDRQRIQIQRPLLSPVDRQGEWANIYGNSRQRDLKSSWIKNWSP